MALGVCMEMAFALYDRFVLGLLQTPGTFGHQNFLGMVSQFVFFPFFALLLAGRWGRLPVIITLAGALIAVLTTSRATVGLDVLGCAVLFALSALRRWTSRKAMLALASVLMVTVLAPAAIASFEARFAKDTQLGAYDERSVMQDAAAMILSDHPMGIGPNHYVLVANVDGYNSRARVAWTSGAAFVHNAYWLVADESGYFGLVTFVILLLCPLTVAFRCGWRNRSDSRGDLLLGFGVALLVVYIHSWFEWIFLTFQMQYMFALTAGAVAGLSQQLGYWRQSAASRVSIGAPAFSAQSGKQVRQN
jgi:O-antigen ligase